MRPDGDGEETTDHPPRTTTSETDDADDDAADRARATTQEYEKRGDLYFLSDKKRATANVKAAIEALDETRG